MIFVILLTEIPYVCPKIIASRSVSFACQLARICSIFARPSFGTSRSRPDWCDSTSSVRSPNVWTIRRANTLPTPLISPDAR